MTKFGTADDGTLNFSFSSTLRSPPLDEVASTGEPVTKVALVPRLPALHTTAYFCGGLFTSHPHRPQTPLHAWGGTVVNLQGVRGAAHATRGYIKRSSQYVLSVLCSGEDSCRASSAAPRVGRHRKGKELIMGRGQYRHGEGIWVTVVVSAPVSPQSSV
ncbi:hypothetical protein Pelo_1228 [Pelomyxa schiedti]|nr:hypothetical protein Pelo_1228 [Pelomyxa schiedti]